MQTVLRILIILGAALMIYNIAGFIKYARFISERGHWGEKKSILYIPIVLLVFFFIGYLGVALFSRPNLLMALILFFGSIFVFIMYKYINRITETIIEKEKLEAQLAAEEETNKSKTAFLAGISHEMRTPMNVILGLDKIALKKPDLDPETRDSLEKIGQSGEHLLGLINNILDVNRINSGELKAKSSKFELKDCFAQINAIAETLCSDKGLLYKTNIDKNAYGTFLGDEMIIKQIVLGLIDNAVKYTDAPGTVGFSAKVSTENDRSKTVEIKVSDTGIGMSEAFMDRIFDGFEREDESATDRFGGIGLGLSSVKKKLGLIGGSIYVSSTKGKGSVFTVNIPLEKYEEEVTGERPDPIVNITGRRILIVEDLEVNAEIVHDLLDLEDAISEHAENGKVAVDMFEASPEYYYDAVLMDLRMPVMDGLEAAKCIRALPRKDAKTVPILALTANAFPSDIRDTFAAGMNEHLVKPVDPDRLYISLEHWINESHKEREGGGT